MNIELGQVLSGLDQSKVGQQEFRTDESLFRNGYYEDEHFVELNGFSMDRLKDQLEQSKGKAHF